MAIDAIVSPPPFVFCPEKNAFACAFCSQLRFIGVEYGGNSTRKSFPHDCARVVVVDPSQE